MNIEFPIAAIPDSDDIDDYPYTHTIACKMLAEGFKNAWENNGQSQRKIARRLGYKTSVALSHMANGRNPIPIDRALGIARILELNEAEFLFSVLEQRHPEVEFRKVLANQPGAECADRI